MKLKYLFIFILLTGCRLQTENSSAKDASTYPAGLVTGTPAFMAANDIMRKSCTPCHPYSSMNENALIDAGLVVPGQPTSSQLYYRILGSSGTSGPKNMPPVTTLTTSELATIYDWIAGI